MGQCFLSAENRVFERKTTDLPSWINVPKIAAFRSINFQFIVNHNFHNFQHLELKEKIFGLRHLRGVKNQSKVESGIQLEYLAKRPSKRGNSVFVFT